MENLLYMILGFFLGSLYIELKNQRRKEVEKKNTLKICNPKYNEKENSWTWELKKRA